ncbi:hypothetical protein D6833_06715 [Candidatus Parcubacteria bacterium]|nr:MAG: hypothetical protein D6833_06715 [Candidatus Parcubacteria bacterium]
MKKLVIAASFLILAGCSDQEPLDQGPVIGELDLGPIGVLRIVCIDGVQYLKGYRSLSAYLRPDGSVRTCTAPFSAK